MFKAIIENTADLAFGVLGDPFALLFSAVELFLQPLRGAPPETDFEALTLIFESPGNDFAPPRELFWHPALKLWNILKKHSRNS